MVVFRLGLMIGLRPFLLIRSQFRRERYAGSRHASPLPFGMGLRSPLSKGESWRVSLVMVWLRIARLVREMSRWSFTYPLRRFRFFSFLTVSQVS